MEIDGMKRLTRGLWYMAYAVWISLAVFVISTPVFAQVYEHATIWGDTAKTWEASWDRSLCGSVQCVEEHYVVRVIHLESGLQAFPDIVTAEATREAKLRERKPFKAPLERLCDNYKFGGSI